MHLQLGRFAAAQADCDAALRLGPSVKAQLRRGAARVAQGDSRGGADDFRAVLALEPHNRQARLELKALAEAEAMAAAAAADASAGPAY